MHNDLVLQYTQCQSVYLSDSLRQLVEVCQSQSGNCSVLHIWLVIEAGNQSVSQLLCERVNHLVCHPEEQSASHQSWWSVSQSVVCWQTVLLIQRWLFTLLVNSKLCTWKMYKQYSQQINYCKIIKTTSAEEKGCWHAIIVNQVGPKSQSNLGCKSIT